MRLGTIVLDVWQHGHGPQPLAGPIEMQLPCAHGAIWHPAAATGMIGRRTIIELDGVRHPVEIVDARPCPDPQYVWVKLAPLA